jgi:hypothetical protein
MNTKNSSKKQKNYMFAPSGNRTEERSISVVNTTRVTDAYPGASAITFMGSADFTTKLLQRLLEVNVEKELQENVQSADLSKAIVQFCAILYYESYH